MIEPEETYVDTRSVACDGGGGPLGHPRVWMAMPASGRIDCPYCGRIFIFRKGAPAGEELQQKAPPGAGPGDDSAVPDAEPQGS